MPSRRTQGGGEEQVPDVVSFPARPARPFPGVGGRGVTEAAAACRRTPGPGRTAEVPGWFCPQDVWQLLETVLGVTRGVETASGRGTGWGVLPPVSEGPVDESRQRERRASFSED